MNVYLFAAVILLLPALCTALGAAGVFLVRRADEPRTRRMLCGMAAGIMLAASVWSLLLPRHRAGGGRDAAGLAGPGGGAGAWGCGPAAAGRGCRAADAHRVKRAWPDGPGGAGRDPPQSARGHGGGTCGGAGPAG
ncbi:MAG: hypothetical protein ACLTGJ_03240 [Faecalibacterium prausnitzii]